MYPIFLLLHSLLRWLVLGSLAGATYLSFQGWVKSKPFTAGANAFRYWAVTLSHIQLVLGMIIYFQSPVVRFPMPDNPATIVNEHSFFQYIHITLMIITVVVITIGSARSKRMKEDRAKYKSMLTWFAVGLFILLIAIPWPFSPLAQRPYIRSF